MLFDSLGNDLNISDRPEVMGPKSSLRITIVRWRRGIREAPSAPSSRQTTTRVALCPFPPSQWKTWMTLSEFGWENRPCSPRVSVQTVAWNSDKTHLIRDVPWLVLGHNSTLAARLLRLATWGYCQDDAYTNSNSQKFTNYSKNFDEKFMNVTLMERADVYAASMSANNTRFVRLIDDACHF